MTTLTKGPALCACGQYWLEANLQAKWVPRFIDCKPLVDEELHRRESCSWFDEEDVSLP